MSQDKVICPNCGSSFFNTFRAEQFLSGGYGTAEFRSLSNVPKMVLVCIGCSTPVTPKSSYYAKGSIADVSEQEFRKSIEAGQKYKKDNSMQTVAQTTASVKEIDDLKLLVTKLQEEISKINEVKMKSKKKTEALATAG